MEALTDAPLEQQLSTFLENTRRETKDLLCKMIVEVEPSLPETEVFVSNTGNTAVVRVIRLGTYDSVASTDYIFLSAEGMYRMGSFVSAIRLKDMGIRYIRMPAWFEREEVGLDDYIKYIPQASTIIQEAKG